VPAGLAGALGQHALRGAARTAREGAASSRPRAHTTHTRGGRAHARRCRCRTPAPDERNIGQLCKHEFVFTPLYAEDAPTRLPWQELARGVVQRAAGCVKVAHRVWVVVSASARVLCCAVLRCAAGSCSSAQRHMSPRTPKHAPAQGPPTVLPVALARARTRASPAPHPHCAGPPPPPPHHTHTHTAQACVWLAVVPWVTCLAWRLAFLHGLHEVPRLLRERANLLAVATDCIQVRVCVWGGGCVRVRACGWVGVGGWVGGCVGGWGLCGAASDASVLCRTCPCCDCLFPCRLAPPIPPPLPPPRTHTHTHTLFTATADDNANDDMRRARCCPSAWCSSTWRPPA
jgi:hypothetical protein